LSKSVNFSRRRSNASSAGGDFYVRAPFPSTTFFIVDDFPPPPHRSKFVRSTHQSAASSPRSVVKELSVPARSNSRPRRQKGAYRDMPGKGQHLFGSFPKLLPVSGSQRPLLQSLLELQVLVCPGEGDHVPDVGHVLGKAITSRMLVTCAIFIARHTPLIHLNLEYSESQRLNLLPMPRSSRAWPAAWTCEHA
ncbi:MAG: hypothetical protein FD177_2812, partial [Desulfovibrionaceae bacterium]